MQNLSLNTKRSDMILHVDSDISYCIESVTKSRAGGYYYLPQLKI